MASNLHVKIDRMSGRGADAHPFYSFHFQNAQACNGRGIDVLLCLSYEDIQALHVATEDILSRDFDHVKATAGQPGTSRTFKEVEGDAPSPVSRKKKFITKEGDIK